MAKYDVESFVNPPDPDFICCICQCVFADPKESPCRHLFCQICIETWLKNKQNCPTCRKKMGKDNLKPALPLIQNVLNRMDMRCSNREAGCLDILPLANFDKHIEQCLYGEVQCKFEKCQEKLLRKSIKTHQENCLFREIKCNKDCGLMILWTGRKTHNCCETLKEYVQEQKKIIEKLRERDRELRQLKDEMTQRLQDLERRRDLETLRQELISAGPGFETFTFDTASDLELTVDGSEIDSVLYADSSIDLELEVESDPDIDTPILLDTSDESLEFSHDSHTETGESEGRDNDSSLFEGDGSQHADAALSSSDSLSDSSYDITRTNRRHNRRPLRSDSEASSHNSNSNINDDHEASAENRTEMAVGASSDFTTYEFETSQNTSQANSELAVTADISLNINILETEIKNDNHPVRRCARGKRRRQYSSSECESENDNLQRRCRASKRKRSSMFFRTGNKNAKEECDRKEDERLELSEEGYELRNRNGNNSHCDVPIKQRLRNSSRNVSPSSTASHACTRMCNCGLTSPHLRSDRRRRRSDSEHGSSSNRGDVNIQGNESRSDTGELTVQNKTDKDRQKERRTGQTTTSNNCDNHENNQDSDETDDTWEPRDIDTPSDLSISEEDAADSDNYEVKIPKTFSEMLALYVSDDDDEEWTPPS